MKNERILNAIGKISDELIEDAAISSQSRKKNFPWKTVIASAACFCLLLTVVFCVLHFLPNQPIGNLPGVTNPTSPAAQGNNNSPLNYGQLRFLTAFHKTDAGVSGKSFQYIAGTQSTGIQAEAAPPAFEFQHGYIHVVAKAVEELGTYETLNEYGSTWTNRYRLFCMEVIDPLESGLDGSFYYLLPEKLKGDLTEYDALLISMMQFPKNFVLRSQDKLTAFDYLFCDPQDTPELGNIIAFTDGIFDESLWQDESWIFGYQFGKHILDNNDDRLLVSRGSTLEDALQRKQRQFEELEEWAKLAQWGDWTKYAQVMHFDFQTEAAQKAMDYVKPFENGIFVPEQGMSNYRIRRYINCSPTNEWISIAYDEETVTFSEYRFEDEDFEKLPDLSTYIKSLDMTKIMPQHTDTTGKILIYNSAVGWYEKTENGVYSIVRIAWRHYDQDDSYVEYYDETFILLDETGDHIISREDLIALIGENRNISEQEYGVGIDMPMA